MEVIFVARRREEREGEERAGESSTLSHARSRARERGESGKFSSSRLFSRWNISVTRVRVREEEKEEREAFPLTSPRDGVLVARERPHARERGYAGERERHVGKEMRGRKGESKRKKSPSLPYARTCAREREGEKEERLGGRMESWKRRRIEERKILKGETWERKTSAEVTGTERRREKEKEGKEREREGRERE